MKIIDVILAILCIFAAIYNFDPHNLTSCVVSALLLIMAIQTLSNTEKLKRVLRGFSVFLAVFLLCKILLGA